MDIKEALKKRKEFEAGIIAKALENPDFRKELLKNPRAVVEREVGAEIPDAFKIKVIEEDPGTVTIVLPQKYVTAKEKGELTSDMLEKISGGGDVGSDSIFKKGVIM